MAMSESNGIHRRNDTNPALRDDVAVQPCVALLELGSVARGVETADAVLWEARVELLCATPVQPGKYVVLFTGAVDDCRSALARGCELAGSELIDQLLLPQVHSQVLTALRRQGGVIAGELDAVGVFETRTVASAVSAADVALKAATVDLIDLRIANGLHGQSFLVLTGEVSDVRSAVLAGADCARQAGHLLQQVVIARPHPELVRHL
jgi:microcompartment protein CcmL/EutN